LVDVTSLTLPHFRYGQGTGWLEKPTDCFIYRAELSSLGRFELADGGTIFLDEIGDLPMDTQVALLRGGGTLRAHAAIPYGRAREIYSKSRDGEEMKSKIIHAFPDYGGTGMLDQRKQFRFPLEKH
jgi:hypothetical protein